MPTARRTLRTLLIVSASVATLAGCVVLPPAVAPAPPIDTTAPAPESSAPAPTEPSTTDPATTPDQSNSSIPGDWTACSDTITATAFGAGTSTTPTTEIAGAGDMGVSPICYLHVDYGTQHMAYVFFPNAESSAQTIATSLTAAGWEASAFGAVLVGSLGDSTSILGSELDPSAEPDLIQALGAGNDVLRLLVMWE